MINKDRLLERFLTYVQIDSPTKEERDFAEFLMKEMKDLGLDVHMDDAGDKVGGNSGNLVGKLKGTTEGETILFSSHMDTVSPGRGIKPEIKDGVIYSDGTTILGGDDKAGIAAIMEALETIKDKDIAHGDIEVVFSIYEEGGLYGAKNLDYSKLEAKYGFVMDSGGSPGEIIIQGPAQNQIDVKFIGKEAHAGVSPEEGISAVQMAGEAISKMKLLRIDDETTANIGLIMGGGATNIVTNQVIFKAEARSLCDEKLESQTNHMVKCCEDAAAKFGGKVEIDISHEYGAFKIEEDSPVVNKVKEACKNIGLEPLTGTTGGGSDTNILSNNGLPAVNLGMGARKAHTLEEHIHIKDLEDAGRLALEIIKVFA